LKDSFSKSRRFERYRSLNYENLILRLVPLLESSKNSSLNIAEIEAPSCNRTIGYRPQDMAMLSIWLGREREREREREILH
jgi:hypothetical protein